MFSKILISNRGEIAVRIIRACREMGIRSAAVYSEADRESLHVPMADEAHPIGPAAPAESYLNIQTLVDTCVKCGADAVHPGYGFLSEQAPFAEACGAAGATFIGPSPETLRCAGDKIASRAVAEAAGVPVIPGAVPEGAAPEEDDAGAWRDEAGRLGYPVLIKAAVGGGGRGMRRAAGPRDIEDALASARAEARAAFGNGLLYLEKMLPDARHVEVQILGDGRGGAIHLGERECSIQRRHQKVFEETPAPGLSPGMREEILSAAVRLASGMNYRGAGTVEFLLPDEGGFYFLEINARLQVEHPITEMATGQDLVALQIRIAAEGRLPIAQDEVRFSGYAIEARLYAEDPARDFLPQTGTIRALHLPTGDGVRVDAGIAPGIAVGADYDPLLAKIVVWGEDRATALDRLEGALAGLRLSGLRTNQAFLAAVARHPAFRSGAFSTDFIEHNAGELGGEIAGDRMADAKIAAVLGVYLSENKPAGPGPEGGRRHDPWDRVGGWLPGGLE
ncbi:MAG: biotin carboxylase N-terminal domain-containing protein [Nitrospinota bacterium]